MTINEFFRNSEIASKLGSAISDPNAMPTYTEVVDLCTVVRECEDGFDPFMIRHLLSDTRNKEWGNIVVPVFLEFLERLSPEEFESLRAEIHEMERVYYTAGDHVVVSGVHGIVLSDHQWAFVRDGLLRTGILVEPHDVIKHTVPRLRVVDKVQGFLADVKSFHAYQARYPEYANLADLIIKTL